MTVMNSEQALAVFENYKIRRLYDETSETWYFSVVDIVAALIQQLKQGDKVKAFPLAKGVECESHTAEPFNVKQMMQSFVDAGGEILACGTCLKLRNSQGTELCPLSTQSEQSSCLDAFAVVEIYHSSTPTCPP